ncbi:MAG: hypothetical protein KA152_03890 [Verrucomicrobiales bacterium]|nr:hypothetical protein [Verrucomicrobiales bacterium]HQW28051.1 CopG family transcriptional regulator [Verrucomicrobiales bacterium]
MRTTLVINDELVAATKRLAADRRTSVSQVVNDALRRELAESTTRSASLSLSIPVYGGSGSRLLDTAPAELDALLHDVFKESR